MIRCTLAACGFAGAYVAARHGHPAGRWAPLAYFSTMEALQGFTYLWIGQCGATPNEALTTLSYLHIAFQPWFVNLFMLSFRPPGTARWWVWATCTLASVVMLAMWLVPWWPGHCDPMGQTICGAVTCSYHGNWHIAFPSVLGFLYVKVTEPLKPVEPTGLVIDSVQK